MLERRMMSELLSWKNDKTTQAFLLTGARQVGKTTLVREFAAREFESIAEINFYENPRAAEILADARSVDDLILRISVLAGKELMPEKTLLFFDEIQEYGDILTWVKFLPERIDIDTVLSGSLLGVGEFASVRSLPVGFVRKSTLYPLRFEEFCAAVGFPRQAWQVMEESLHQLKPVPDFIHDQLIARFREYLLIGGMPAAVQAYVETGQLIPARNIQRAIFDFYEEDMTKYVGSRIESRQIKMVYESIPAQLNTPVKRFKYTRLGKSLRFANMETAFDWLSASGVAIESTRVGQVTFPLGLTEDRQSFKLFMNDVGILTSRLMGDVDIDIISSRTNINYGSIYENIIAQELTAAGFTPHHYSNKSRGEIDFLIEDPGSGDVRLIEVKSGKNYKRHSALKNVIESGEAESAVILYNGNVEIAENRIYLPVYAVSLMRPGDLLMQI